MGSGAAPPEAVEVTNRLAPEHVQVATVDTRSIVDAFRHDGRLFARQATPEVLGDDGTGPNHVLPTGGTARFRAGLSVLTFLRAQTWIEIEDAATAITLYRDAARLARHEGLEAHARAAELRATDRGGAAESDRVTQ